MADRDESELTIYFNKRIAENETQLLEIQNELRRVNDERLEERGQHDRELRRVDDEKVEQRQKHDNEMRKAMEETAQTKKEMAELEKTMMSAISFLKDVPKSIAVDAEAQHLVPLVPTIKILRQNISKIGPSYDRIKDGYRFWRSVRFITIKNFCGDASENCNELLERISSIKNNDNNLIDSAKISVIELRDQLLALEDKIFQNQRTDTLDIPKIDFTNLELTLAKIPSFEFAATSKKAILELNKIYDAERQRHETRERKCGGRQEDEEKEEYVRKILDDSVRVKKEILASDLQANRDRMRAQISTLLKHMQHTRSSAQIDQELAQRLIWLKSTHEPVRTRFLKFNQCLQSHIRGLENDGYVKVDLALLMDELLAEITIMSEEVTEMEQLQHKHPDARFLRDIEESARSVATAASELLFDIEELEKELKIGERTISYPRQAACKCTYEKLEKRVEEIPTVQFLKEKYK